jgi:hypothetical protein
MVLVFLPPSFTLITRMKLPSQLLITAPLLLRRLPLSRLLEVNAIVLRSNKPLAQVLVPPTSALAIKATALVDSKARTEDDLDGRTTISLSACVMLLLLLVLSGTFLMKLNSTDWPSSHTKFLQAVICKIFFWIIHVLILSIPNGPFSSASYGHINFYDKSYDRINTRNEKVLQHIDRSKYDYTTSDDPVMQQFMQENKGTVYATDSILALLMCAPRTVYPWDIVITRVDDKVILDKRDGGAFGK